MEYLDRAQQISREVTDRRAEGQLATGRGCALIESEQLAEAHRELERALAIHRDVENRLFEGITLAYRGLAYFLGGDVDRAFADYDAALLLLNFPRAHGLTIGARAGALAWLGRFEEARRDLAVARRHLERTWVDSDGVFLDAIEAHLLQASGADADVVEARVAPYRNSSISGFEARIAIRTLDRFRRDEQVDDRPKAEVGRLRLELSRDGAWFRVGAAAPVELRRQGALRLILLRLARQAEAAPGTAVSLQALARAGWPDESEIVENRVYVAVSRLKKRGLSPLLVSRDDGWLLVPPVEVEWAADAHRQSL
jgi:hypothetical protein